MEDISNDDYTLTGVLQFISSKFHEFDLERIKWTQEREELLKTISSLENEKAYLEQQLVEIVNTVNPHTDDYSASLRHSLDVGKSATEAARYKSINRLTATRKVLQRYLNKYESEGSGQPTSAEGAGEETTSPTSPMESRDTPPEPVPEVSVAWRETGERGETGEGGETGEPASEPVVNQMVNQIVEKRESEEEDGLEGICDDGYTMLVEMQRKTQEKRAEQKKEAKRKVHSPVSESSPIAEPPSSFPLDMQIDKASQIPRYCLTLSNRFHLAPIRHIQFSSNEGGMVSVDERNTICMWDFAKGEVCINAQPSQVLYGERDRILCSTWMSSLQSIATAGSEGNIYVYRIRPSNTTCFYQNGTIKKDDKKNRGFNYMNGLFDSHSAPSYMIYNNHSDAVWSLYYNDELASSNHMLFSSSASGAVIANDLEKENEVHYDIGTDRCNAMTSNNMYSSQLFCGCQSGRMKIIDIENKQVVREFSPLSSNTHANDPITTIAIHPALPLLATGTHYGNIHLFDIRDPKVCVSYSGHRDSVCKVEFHPWFNTVLSSGYDNSIRVWCARDRTLIHQYTKISNPLFDESASVFSVCSNTGSLVTGGADGVLHCFI